VNASWTFFGNAVHAAAFFAMTIVLAKLGSPEDVGRFALGLATTAPIFMLASLRLRDLQAIDVNQEYVFEDYFALRLATTVASLLVITCIALLGGFDLEMKLVIVATGASKGLEAISDAFYGLFMQQERLDRSAKSLILKGPFSLLLLAIAFYLTGSVFWGVMGIVVARAVVMVGYDTRNLRLSLDPTAEVTGQILPQDLPRPRFDFRTMGKLVALSLPLGLVTMLISLHANIPRYFIEGYLGSYQLGIFSAITAFQKVAPTVVQALGRSAAPRLAKYHASRNARAFRRLSLRLVGIGALLGAGGMLVAFVAGRPILTLFYGPEYALPELFTLVMGAAALDYLATMVLFTVTAARYFRIQLPLHVLTTASGALACYLLVPSLGLWGAAIALAATYGVRFLGTSIAAAVAIRELSR
jgi:O-antigen/teichoic acid export membrane protein